MLLAAIDHASKGVLLTDSNIRDLERRWRESGQVDDAAALLCARARAGVLSPEHLLLAAFLKHDAALLAAETLGLEVHPESDAPMLGRWLVVLTEWGIPVGVRGSVAVARFVLERAGVSDPRPHELVDALMDWSDEPSLANFAGVKRLHDSCLSESRWSPQPTEEAIAVSVPMTAARAVVENQVFWTASAPDLEWTWPGGEWPRDERVEQIRELVRSELTEWCLRDQGRPRTQEPASLRQRVAEGDLAGDKVLLAAHLGVMVAAEALGESAPDSDLDLEAWFQALLGWPEEIVLRGAFQVADLALPVFELRDRSALPRGALQDLRTLSSSPWSSPAIARALQHLRGLVLLGREISPRAQPALHVFQHALTLPWFIDPFPSNEDESEGLVLSSWSGTNEVELGEGETFLRVHGGDGAHVWRVEFDGETDLTQGDVLRRVSSRLIAAALEAGVSEEAIRTRLREELGTWALESGGDRWGGSALVQGEL